MDTIELTGLTSGELRQLMTQWSEPAFRGAQVYNWIYKGLVDNIDGMRNLPRTLRTMITQRAVLDNLAVERISVADDGLSEKILFQTKDGQYIESVLLSYAERCTVCLSSQVGCALGCLLCATGQSGFVRDLSAGEMVSQLLYFSRQLKQEERHITNVVLMGMGEPLLNYDAVRQMLRLITDPAGLGIGARRITISTAGVIPGIERLTEEDLGVKLAISLHAPDDALRSKLVPLNRRYPLARLITAAAKFTKHTGRRVTFEYALAAGINDSMEQAQRTAQLLAGLYCHVNLIPLYETLGCNYKPSAMDRILAFEEVLQKSGIRTTIRLRRGGDISAGCGQLRGMELADEDEDEQ
ncbi:MAG: 23S rRNA (adenine(2503)-C(2))-methyltransferase RlmN [Chloroflexi bacterium]|nr:23S rRNA (adenine(2503)-C(2))-methyltransferase RlmN [Chloroflexota bacterium]